MTKDGKRSMDVHGITGRSHNVFCYKDFAYDRLAKAARKLKSMPIDPHWKAGICDMSFHAASTARARCISYQTNFSGQQ